MFATYSRSSDPQLQEFFLFLVLFITYFRLNTLVPIPVGNNCPKTPMRGFYQKTTAEGI